MASLLRAFIFGLVMLGALSAQATLTYDLRLVSGSGGPKSQVGLSVNQQVQLALYAVVTGEPGASAQEGFQFGYVSIVSSYGGTTFSIRGNLTGTLTTIFSASQSQNGTSQDLDGDGDKDLGSNGTQSDGAFIRAMAASMQTTSGTVITDGREFKLMNITFTVTSIANPLDPTPMTINARIAEFTSPIETEDRWQEDGITKEPPFTGPTGVQVGTPVLLKAIPEPGVATLLLVGAVGLAARRRRCRAVA